MIGTTIGIEISAKMLRIAAIQQRLSRRRLVFTDEVPGFPGLSVEDQRLAITNLATKHKISPGRVFLTLPRDRGIVRQVEFPAEIGANLRSAVSLQIEALSPWAPHEIYWD